MQAQANPQDPQIAALMDALQQPKARRSAQGVSIALMAAAIDGCDCRACQVLREMASVSIDIYLSEGSAD